MEFISTQRYIKVSPKKIREVALNIKKLRPAKAVEVLPFVAKRGSIYLEKVIKTAIANAVQKGVTADELYFKEIQVSEGPRLKRGTPVSKGRWHPIKKRMSHIRVVLETKEKEVAKKVEKAEVKEAKIEEAVKKVEPKKVKKTSVK